MALSEEIRAKVIAIVAKNMDLNPKDLTEATEIFPDKKSPVSLVEMEDEP